MPDAKKKRVSKKKAVSPAGAPLVSIIMSAYNRSNVLKLAVSTVISQTFTKWELLIIGDACTDDTAEVAASFNDPRIRFVNLARNCGEQSGPNNEGFRLSRGKYIAYLNQDDFWFPDHLERGLAQIEKCQADWVYSLAFAIYPGDGVKISGIMPGNEYSPLYGQSIFASQWMIRREVLEKLGGWRPFRDIWMVPSQDLMLRAHNAGSGIYGTEAVTAILIQSADRRNSYSTRACDEHLLYYERLESDPAFRQKMLLSAIRHLELKKKSVPHALKTAAWTLFCRCSAILGVSPFFIYHICRFGRKKGWLNHMRQKRGLPKLD